MDLCIVAMPSAITFAEQLVDYRSEECKAVGGNTTVLFVFNVRVIFVI